MKILLLILLAITTTNSKSNRDTYEHLQIPTIREICSVIDRAAICASNNTHVCTVRKSKGRLEYSDYENSCYLFLNNMCEHPGNEFYIAGSGACKQRLVRQRTGDPIDIARRQINNTQGGDVTEPKAASSEEPVEAESTAGNEPGGGNGDPGTLQQETASEITTLESASRPLGRMRLVTPASRHNVSEAYDSHPCPGHCTEEYQPVCLIANRGFGIYFKYLTFLNHCQADMYYCSHVAEFAPPPDESEEMISGSKLDWSFCASYRFLQFARFSEVASSMGHYGWLLGDRKYSHILAPAERLRLSGSPRHVPG